MTSDQTPNIEETRRREALEILARNDRGEHSVPTHGLYPVQFNWDSAFAAVGYRLVDTDRAWRELELLADAQWPDGMIPHIIFRGGHDGYFPGPAVWQTGRMPPTSGITQPPVLASLVRYLVDKHGAPSRGRLLALLDRTAAWHQWFLSARRDPDSGAILVVHPWESGRDNLADWDSAMARVPVTVTTPYQRRDLDHVDAAERPSQAEYDRYLSIIAKGVEVGWDQPAFGRASPFRMVDPGITAILLRAQRDLAALYETMGEAERARRAADLIGPLEDGLRALWSPEAGAFTAIDPVTGVHTGAVTSASFLAPYAGLADTAYLGPLLDHFDRIAGRVRFMVPSTDPAHHGYDPARYWRGPVWFVVNRMITQGLAEIGESDRARRVWWDTKTLALTEGFAEYYHPETGRGLGGQSFTWTAAVFLDWLADLPHGPGGDD